jgi:hypothetical protein
MATTVIFFYDYLLTLSDEVGRVYSARALRSLIRPRFIKGYIYLAWQEIMGCVDARIDLHFYSFLGRILDLHYRVSCLLFSTGSLFSLDLAEQVLSGGESVLDAGKLVFDSATQTLGGY